MTQKDVWLFKYNPDATNHNWKSIEAIKKGFEEDGHWSQSEKEIVKYNNEDDIKDGDTFICLNKSDSKISFMCKVRKPSKDNDCDFDYIEPLFFDNAINCEDIFGVPSEKLYELLVPDGKQEKPLTPLTLVSLFNLSSHGEYLTKLMYSVVKQNNESISHLTETLQRMQADFENYKKRLDKENNVFKKYATQDFILKLLPVLDSFELALRNADAEKDKFVRGIEMIYAQFFSVLESEGLKPINAVGKKFDTYYHEALLQEKSDNEEDIVLEELQKGYVINERVIRFAKVKISKK